ncbi:MAG: DUF3780 domain-containing protein [Methylococcales bacterium]|nr:DUF3780 domain-containing protein [Methylococcales bacterium]
MLGKELYVLAWVIEGRDIGDIPIAVRNWLALRHALGDVAQNERLTPSRSRTPSEKMPH